MGSQRALTPKAEYLGYLVTNAIKVGGLIVGSSEAFTHEEVRPLVMAFAALAIAGGQGLEALLPVLRSFFGKAPQ